MPPKKGKKKGEEETEVYLGRPGNSVKMGIVGMPNVGKSTIFNIMSNLHVAAENYPFCTIDPNLARVPVPDSRYDVLVEKFKPKSEVPAVLTVTDIAGLVKGASEGKGLGNAFLSHIFAVDGIYHVCRAFKDKEIEHVEGSVDPIRDLDIISTELRLKDLDRLKGLTAPLKKGAISQKKEKKEQLDMLTRFIERLEAGKPIRGEKWGPKDVEYLNTLQLLTAKPIVYLVNISRKNFIEKKNKWLGPVKKWAQEYSPGAVVVPFSATFEAEYMEADDDTKKKLCEEHKVQSMVPRIVTGGYHALDLIHFFTCGKDEVRAWTIRRGTKAPQAAGTIHTDFESGFICADTIAYTDFEELGGEKEAKNAGKMRMEGKAYTVVDGDIMHFKFNN